MSHTKAAHDTKNFAASQDQPQSEVSKLSRIPSWKQAIIRYQRRQAKRLEAQQPTLVLETA